MEYNKKTVKILIVDDNRIDLELLEAILTRIGFQKIIKSESGKEAIQLAEEHQPDLFLVDIMMPGMSGGDFRGHLKQNPVTRDIPVIFISGIISKEEERELGGRLASGDFIIAKPFTKDRIAEAIDAALKKAPL